MILSNTEINREVPKGWLPTSMGKFIELEYGKGLVKTDRNERGKFPVYGSSGIVGYHNNYLVEGPALIIGRKGAAGEVSYSDKNCWPIDTTYFIRKLKNLNIRFVFYALKVLRLKQYDRSTAIPGLNRNDVYEIPFNLPPLTEQQQIIAKIEELFSELDNGIESLKKAQAQLKTYRQAVLKYAFEDDLTANKNARQRFVKLEELCDFITKGTTPLKGKLFQKVGDIPFIKVYNLTFSGKLDFTVDPTFVDYETHNGFLARSRVFPGDVLMNIVGPPLGKVAIVPNTYPEWNINQAIVRFRCRPNLNSKFHCCPVNFL